MSENDFTSDKNVSASYIHEHSAKVGEWVFC